jgi:hypothetical protein
MPKKAKASNASGANEPSKWRSKIVGHEKVQAGQLMANPFNHRRHPEKQRKVVAASIEELGFIKSVIVNKVTGHIVDGHERVMQALGVGEETLVDVEYVELSPEDEKKALLVLDASSELAEVDASSLDQLVKECSFQDNLLGDFASEMLGSEEPGRLKDLEIKPAPARTWVLIGIDTTKYVKIAKLVEQIADLPETILETSCTDG